MDGFKQGLITAGLNHVASMVEVGIAKLEEQSYIEKKLKEYYGDNYKNITVTAATLDELAIIFSDMYNKGAQKYSIATKNSLPKGHYLLDNGKIGTIYLEVLNGITDMWETGSVQIAPARMQDGIVSFASTWYHETIHSIHFVSGEIYKYYDFFLSSGYPDASRRAINVSEYTAHSQTNNAVGCITYDNYYQFYPDYKLYFGK